MSHATFKCGFVVLQMNVYFNSLLIVLARERKREREREKLASQLFPEKARLEMLVEMQIEILYGDVV